MVDGLPYTEKVGGSSPSVPTKFYDGKFEVSDLFRFENAES